MENTKFQGTSNWGVSEKRGCYRYLSGGTWNNFASVVVQMNGEDELSEEGVANFNLIQSAPDLLEALQEVRKAFQWRELTIDERKAFNKADTAIFTALNGKEKLELKKELQELEARIVEINKKLK